MCENCSPHLIAGIWGCGSLGIRYAQEVSTGLAFILSLSWPLLVCQSENKIVTSQDGIGHGMNEHNC